MAQSRGYSHRHEGRRGSGCSQLLAPCREVLALCIPRPQNTLHPAAQGGSFLENKHNVKPPGFMSQCIFQATKQHQMRPNENWDAFMSDGKSEHCSHCITKTAQVYGATIFNFN